MDDDTLLDAVADQAGGLADLDLAELLPRLRSLIQETLTARRPDGTWPATEVLAEVLRAHLDLLDERLAAEGVAGDDLPGDTRWLDAWRNAAEHPATLDAMLATLRDDLGDGVQRVPTYPPPAELHVVDPAHDPAVDPGDGP